MPYKSCDNVTNGLTIVLVENIHLLNGVQPHSAVTRTILCILLEIRGNYYEFSVWLYFIVVLSHNRFLCTTL